MLKNALTGTALLLAVAAASQAGEPAIQWLNQIGPNGPAMDVGSDLAMHGGFVYVTGYVGGTLPGQTELGILDSFLIKYAADGSRVWIRQFGTDGQDMARTVAADESGVYVAGEMYGSSPGNRIFVRKFDADGNEIWAKYLEMAFFDRVGGLGVDATGVYLGGDTSGAFPGFTNAGASDAFLRKLDRDGNTLWIEQVGSPGFDRVHDVSTGPSGTYLAIQANEAFPGQVKVGAFGGDAVLVKYKADGTRDWIRQFGHYYLGASAGAVFADAGGVYVGGSTWGTLTSQPNQGSLDAFVRRYDADGNEVWTDMFGSSSMDNPSRIFADSAGVYVCGDTRDALPGQVHLGFTDAFLRKYDLAGTPQWTRQYGTAGSDSAIGVGADATGIYTTGPQGGVHPLGSDLVTTKFDQDGGPLWEDVIATESVYNDFAYAVDANGAIYVAGATHGIFPGQTTTGAFVGGTDAFLQRYDSFGNEIWTRQFGSASLNGATGVAVHSSGTYVSGDIQGAFPGQTHAGRTDAFVRKYDADGNELWTRQFGTITQEREVKVAADATGVYVTGWTGGTMPGQTSSGDTDVFLVKFDHDGNELWTVQFGTSGNERPYGISASASGIYLTGMTTGAFPDFTSTGGFDIFVRKYDIGGNVQWTRQFGSGSNTDSGRAIFADGAGVYVGGYTGRALPGQAWLGRTDAFVRRYDAAGNEIWTRTVGTSTTELGLALIANDTGVYIGGYTDGAFAGFENSGGQDPFVRKLDPAGNEVWTYQFGTDDQDRILGLASDANGIIVVGDTYGQFEGDPPADPQSDGFVARIVETSSGISVAPRSVDVAGVKIRRTTTAIVTIQNVGDADLTLSGISLTTGDPFSISSAPSVPFVVAAGATADVEITFAPVETGDYSSALKIQSNDPNRPLVTVPLAGAGIALEPEEQFSDILAFFDQGVADGTLEADGPAGRLGAFRSMLEAAGKKLGSGDSSGAIASLTQAYRRVDGEPQPPDFVTGTAATELAAWILELIAMLDS